MKTSLGDFIFFVFLLVLFSALYMATSYISMGIMLSANALSLISHKVYAVGVGAAVGSILLLCAAFAVPIAYFCILGRTELFIQLKHRVLLSILSICSVILLDYYFIPVPVQERDFDWMLLHSLLLLELIVVPIVFAARFDLFRKETQNP